MSLREHSFAHTGLKIVSVALAVLLWMMVSSQRASVERGLRIPLELQNLPENLEMVEPAPGVGRRSRAGNGRCAWAASHRAISWPRSI